MVIYDMRIIAMSLYVTDVADILTSISFKLGKVNIHRWMINCFSKELRILLNKDYIGFAFKIVKYKNVAYLRSSIRNA